jgi:NTE family protein
MKISMHKIPKIGLALSGGAARGLAHIGVLKALKEESIPIDMIAGTSAGAAIGACYAKDRVVATLEEMALGMDWKKLARFADLNLILLGKGFLHGQRVKSLLTACIGGDIKFEDLEIPLAVVAADVQSMEEIVIDKGSVVEAVRASISLPVVFTPVKWGERFLIDGGVVNPMPVDVVRSMGAEIVIAVNVLYIAQPKKHEKLVDKKVKTKPPLGPESTHLLLVKKRVNNLLRLHRERIKTFDELSRIAEARTRTGRGKLDPKTPNIFEVLMQIMHAMQYEKTRLATKYADIVIYPDVSHIGAFDFLKGEEIISRGYKATKDILPKLQEMVRSISSPPL